MANFDAWLDGGVDAIDTAQRAAEAWRRIQRSPASIVFVRGNAALPAQTVRVEDSSASREVRGLGDATSNIRAVVVFGVRGHAAVADTNIQRGDRFAWLGNQYRIVNVSNSPGEVQAEAELIS